MFMALRRKVETEIFLQRQRSWEMGQWNGCSFVEAIISSLHIYYFLEYERALQAEKTALLGQTCCAECGRRLTVISFLHVDLTVISWKLMNLGKMVVFLTVLAEFLLFYSTP